MGSTLGPAIKICIAIQQLDPNLRDLSGELILVLAIYQLVTAHALQIVIFPHGSTYWMEIHARCRHLAVRRGWVAA